MAKGIYVGVESVARSSKKVYVGIDGTARKIKKVYVGVNGVARLCYESFVNPLNTDQLTLGQHDVYFTAYPSLKWCVDHLDGDYAYLGLYNCTENTAFGSNVTYSGSTIAAKCTTFLNNTIPNVAQYLENVTVHSVTNKVFIPSRHMFDGTTGYGDDSGVVFDWTKASANNRKACTSGWGSIYNAFRLSSPYTSSDFSYNWLVNGYGDFSYTRPTSTYGFRPEVKVRYK